MPETTTPQDAAASAAPAAPAACGCAEHESAGMRRRTLLAATAGLGAAAATVGIASPAEALTRLTFADAGYTGDTLVVLSFRGGFDGLSAVAPVADPAYRAARPSIGIPVARGIQLDTLFAMHPAMAPLLPFWNAGSLAFVHAMGQPQGTRSHFTDMDEMERAAPGSSLRSGWLDRMVGATTTPGPFAGTAMGASSAPRSFVGTTPDLALRSVDSFSLSGAWDATETTRWTTALTALHADATPVLQAPATTTLGALTTTAALRAAGYAPAGGAVYPSGGLGDALRDTARLVKAGVGLRAVTIDSGNWDMHTDLGGVDRGWMQRQLAEVASALAAFMTDLGTAASKVTLVTLSEFGRRVAENGSGGLDHGYGNVSFVLGGGVRGKTVYGSWPGLDAAQLLVGDLRVTTDYRVVLAEILEKRCGITGSTVFPGVPSQRLGVVNARA